MPGGYGAYGPLARHVRYAERAARRLARATFYGMARWQGRLERKQGFLGRLVDIGAELFAISASCARAKAERAEHPEGWELADLFCRQSRRRVEALFDALFDNTDAEDVSLAKKVAAGRYVSVEAGVLGLPEDGAWVSTWEPGPSKESDVRRHVPRLSGARGRG
jgi:hypothetical protein